MNIWTTIDPASRARTDHVQHKFVEPVHVGGPKTVQSPLIFSFAHSGRIYPEFFQKQTKLDPTELRSSEDAWVDRLYLPNYAPKARFIHALFPRAWVDANRHPSAIDPHMFYGAKEIKSGQTNMQLLAGLGVIPKVVADGREIYHTLLPVSEIQQRLENTHTPYHQAIERAIAQAKQKFGAAVLIDCHSMPSVCIEKTPNKNCTIVIGDRHQSSCIPALSDCITDAFYSQGLMVSRNLPYAGGYSVARYGKPEKNVHAIQIECARNLYMDEKTIEPHDGFDAFRDVLSNVMGQIDQFAQTISH